MEEIRKQNGLKDCEWYLSKTGRLYTLEVSFLVEKGTFQAIAEQDRNRNDIWNKLKQQGVHIWLTVSFTEQEQWL